MEVNSNPTEVKKGKPTSKEIVALNDFEHVLHRPTMYVGSVDQSDERLPLIRETGMVFDTKTISVGYYKLMIEILDNAFDEAKRMKGSMKRVEIHFSTKENSVKVIDTGGGFLNASKINEKTGVSNVESAFTLLRAGSNFYNETSDENLIGTNGVGAALVNMLSEKFLVKTVNDHETYEQAWSRFVSDGPKVSPVKGETGTTVTFVPRKDKFKGCYWDREYVHTYMLFKRFLLDKDPFISNLNFKCFFDGQELDLGIKFIPENAMIFETKLGQLIVWESFSNSASASFVNGAICTGQHQRVLCDHINNIFENPLAGRFYETLINLNLPPRLVKFGDQNKTRFVTSRGDLTEPLEKAFFRLMTKQLKGSEMYDRILKRIADLEHSNDVRNLKNKKKATRHKISDKYFPPSVKAGNIFLVEGDSAKGSILQRRDPKFDAVYALRGKVRNARRISDLTSNNEIIDLMNILNIEPDADKSAKFERVIIATDADPDGIGHIASLIVNLFYRWFPNVIRQGKLFILQTPLLSVEEKGGIKYFYSMKDFRGYCTVKTPKGIRYLKGLGSLSKQDWENVFSDMRLLKITEDKKSERMIEMAFGANAGLRKNWLQS
jgi:DNA gyrase/topoisomerase IV subunit B